MRSPSLSISTRTREFTPRELPLLRPPDPPPPAVLPVRPPSDRIKEALMRWLEEEL